MKKDKVIRHGNTTHYKSQSCYVCKGEKPKYIEQVTHKPRQKKVKIKKKKHYHRWIDHCDCCYCELEECVKCGEERERKS